MPILTPILTFFATLSRKITTNTTTESSLRWHQYTSGTFPNVKRRWRRQSVRVCRPQAMNSMFVYVFMPPNGWTQSISPPFPRTSSPNPKEAKQNPWQQFSSCEWFTLIATFCFASSPGSVLVPPAASSDFTNTNAQSANLNENKLKSFFPLLFLNCFERSPKESGGQTEKAEKSGQIQVYRHRGGRRRRGLRWRWWVTSGSTSLGHNSATGTHRRRTVTLCWCLSGVRFYFYFFFVFICGLTK